MPSAEPDESGLAPGYGTNVGSLTPPTITGVPGAEAGTAAVAAVDGGDAVGCAGALTVAAATGAVVGGLAGVGAALGPGTSVRVELGLPQAASSGRPTELAKS